MTSKNNIGFDTELMKISTTDSQDLKLEEFEDVFDENILKEMNRKEKSERLVNAIESGNFSAVDTLIKAGAWSSVKTKLEGRDTICIFDLILMNYSKELVNVMPKEIIHFPDWIGESVIPGLKKDLNSAKWVADSLYSANMNEANFSRFMSYASWLGHYTMQKDFILSLPFSPLEISEVMNYCADKALEYGNIFVSKNDIKNHHKDFASTCLKLKASAAIMLAEFGFYEQAIDSCKNNLDVSAFIINRALSRSSSLEPGTLVLFGEISKEDNGFDKDFNSNLKILLKNKSESLKNDGFDVVSLDKEKINSLNFILPSLADSTNVNADLGYNGRTVITMHATLKDIANDDDLLLTSLIISDSQALHVMMKKDGIKEKIVEKLKSSQPLMLHFIKKTSKTAVTSFFSKNKDSFKDWFDVDGRNLTDYFNAAIHSQSWDRFTLTKQLVSTLISINPESLLNSPHEKIPALIDAIKDDKIRSFAEKRIINSSIGRRGSKKTKALKF